MHLLVLLEWIMKGFKDWLCLGKSSVDLNNMIIIFLLKKDGDMGGGSIYME